MSPALQAVAKLSELTRTLAAATARTGKPDAWFAERLGCGREHFNRVRNGKAHLTFPQFVCWSVLVGVELQSVISGSQQGEGERDGEAA